ncbi:MAG: deoxyribodipyrimidine photo-lyase [Bacteroidales bacterium]|nr:MAG: deoxyribodipyrimidine photo-lyase [Bacteroidales bacterium]
MNKSLVNPYRVRELNANDKRVGPVVYWMSRDQRVNDNWALIYAIEKAYEYKTSLSVVFTLAPSFPNANLRHYDFMLKGLVKVEEKLMNLGISFDLLLGFPEQTLPEYIKLNKIKLLVSDFDPLLIKREWKNKINNCIDIPHHEVDTHNIVPCWHASNKLEFGAYTLRPKIKKYLTSFLDDFPSISPTTTFSQKQNQSNFNEILEWLNPDSTVKPIDWIYSGEDEASKTLNIFLSEKLSNYSTKRNDPNVDGQSNLSVYLHYGQISAQRIAIEVLRTNAPQEDKDAFLEELIVRRELSDNFCLYNPEYVTTKGFHRWAKETHEEHRRDEREYLYTLEQLENAKTHDNLWNAAQNEMVKTGKMHGFMRMYWAKKILEWTNSPEEAMNWAIYLNDKYSIDGRDPNGYAGIAWSIGGTHDRAWAERPIFGKIRYMNYNGCKRKFNVDNYIAKHFNNQNNIF